MKVIIILNKVVGIPQLSLLLLVLRGFLTRSILKKLSITLICRKLNIS